MIKDLNAAYESGKRSKSWAKHKPPRFDFDVVVTGARYGEGKRANVFGSFDKAIADGNLSNEVVFRLTVADDGSQSFSDKYKMTEQIIDPSANISSFTQASMNAAGRMFDFIADAGHVTNTGTAGVQSFTKGQKISGGLKVSSSVNTSIRGNFTFVFRTTGGMEFA